ncbi:phosphodiesterase [Pseudomonas sp. R3.Fl]|uniref:phosphodiesterase n=1 Tax=Pseudomonas sp. R3.Fl TaxID=2928708 RepID=UPI00201D3147|nr:phosphodiesterase [Pseudomonas sp. R3.Fl]MCL6692023.1 phosphodiesterase [Pseudomonas sp. R3.Fl]
MKALYIPFLLLCLGMALPAAADTREIPVGAQGDARVALPARGESRRAVLERFGLPDEEHPAVGSPPITRWDYREFSVYFEYDHVVDAVRAHRPQNPILPSPKEPQ